MCARARVAVSAYRSKAVREGCAPVDQWAHAEMSLRRSDGERFETQIDKTTKQTQTDMLLFAGESKHK
eukprot:5295077-Pleurochrysis_carterae.AAC.2